MPAMNKLAPFLWFNENAEEAAEFYLSVFPHARRLDGLRSKGSFRGSGQRAEDCFNLRIGSS
jgi:predicted 3-demethylubiquinone-9 3-methyltransferase (glyoxalase superfamily)